MYLDGESLASIGRELNYNSQTIKRNLIKIGVQIRTRSQQTALTNMKRKKSTIEDYFSNIDNLNKAWVMGFLASDGTIRKDCNEIKIGLSRRDREVLEKIKEEMKIETNIRDYQTSSGFDISELVWSSKQQKADLSKYGIVNKKTYSGVFLPDFKDDNYKLAYILGYFDGDGSISITSNRYLRFRLCSHTKLILEQIAQFFKNKYNASYSLSKDNTREMYELSISTHYANQIFSDMYSLNTICLKRKLDKFLEYKATRLQHPNEDEKIC